ncbi:hypothetical protein, partial [Psychrobacillus sp. NPDC096623]|uniref:hypothetical protein n=1 Tax=Psychrobacillus sp. NPDC096623 TaxID=3364492 RepID=UPI003821A5FE
KTSRYTVTVLYEDGSTKNITTLATAIIVDNEGNVVKGITASGGTLRALTIATKGNYTIKVSYGGKEDTVALKVVPVLTKLTADQPSLVVTTASPTQLAITAHYNDNSSEDVTQAATYTSSNAKLATVDETGKITVLDKTKTGSVVITVKYGTKTLSIPVTVEKVVTGVEIQEDSLLVEIGKTSRYTVTVLHEDGSTKNISTLATAIIVDGEGNVVKGITASGGTLRALTTATRGNYTIKVSYGGKEATQTVNIIPALMKIVADKTSYVITEDKPAQPIITAFFNDGSNEEITKFATFTSSNPKLIEVDSNGIIRVVDPTKNGSARITVKLGTKTIYINVTCQAMS